MKTGTILVIICLLVSVLSPVAITVSASGNNAGVFLATIEVCHSQGTGLSADSDAPFIIPVSISVSTPVAGEMAFMTTDTSYSLLTPFEMDRPPDFSLGLS
jgi:hypothetical protein